MHARATAGKARQVPKARPGLLLAVLAGVAVAIIVSAVATDPCIEAVRDLTEPHAAAAAIVTFVLALTPLWLSAGYIAYRWRHSSTGTNKPVVAAIIASCELSLIFLGPKRSSGEDAYHDQIAEHGGQVARAIAAGGDGAAFVAVAVLPTLIVTAIICQRKNEDMSDQRFGQIAVSVLLVVALVVLVLTLNADLTSPLQVTPSR